VAAGGGAGPEPRLSDAPVGATVVITSIEDGLHGRGRRLEDLGFLPGTTVRVERRAPLGDPVLYQLRGVRMAIRLADADLVRVSGGGGA
jgi:ferrous iron transport protein A